MKKEYVTYTQDEHGRKEELQWARLMGSGEAVKGMVVVYLQKMCAAFHEFEPAYRAGGLNEGALPFFRQRLAGRVRAVLVVMENNGLMGLAGCAELAEIERAALAAGSLEALAGLAKPVHKANHIVTDAVEAYNSW